MENTTLCDGAGWTPEKCLHSDMIRTEYKMKYNCLKTFQKMSTPVTPGKLKKKVKVYDFEDH